MKLLTLICTLIVSLGATTSALGADLGDNAALGYWQAFAQLPQLSKKDRDVLSQWRNADLKDQQVQELLQRSESALKQLKLAVKQQACDWGLDKNQGVYLLLPHLSKSRDLTRIALLNARAELAAGNVDQALAELSATAKLANDTSQPPLLVSTLVGLSLQRNAQDWITDAATKLTKEQRATLLANYDAMFPQAKLSDSTAAESDILLTWLKTEINNPKFLEEIGKEERGKLPKGNLLPAFMKKQLVLLEADYKELIAVSDADLATLIQTQEKLVDRAQKESRLLSSILLPALSSARVVLDRSNTQTEMIRAGLLQLQGETEAANAVIEPQKDKPFKINQDDKTLTVKATLKDRKGSPLQVTFKLK